MLINADFSKRASLLSKNHQWIQSPQTGVERVMLDRVGAEKARATSLVRYAPDSYFPHHLHPGGEEILVLSGVFSADDQHYPAGWYLRNPPSSGHKPYSETGAVIFVKLWQMPTDEATYVTIDTQDETNWHRKSDRSICPLFSSKHEQVCLQRIDDGAPLLAEPCHGGAEILVVAGEILEADMAYQSGSWLRLPHGEYVDINAGSKGATVYLKIGHLIDIIGLSLGDAV